VLVTAARSRMLPNLKSLGWAAARDGGRYCDTKSQVVLLNVINVMIQPGGRALCPRAAGASLATVRSQARSRRRKAESHGGPTAGNDG
jgi:hypothetical protein